MKSLSTTACFSWRLARAAGRVTIRKRPCFSLGKVDVHPKNLVRIYRLDGYDYPKTIQKGGKRIPLSPKDDSPLR